MLFSGPAADEYDVLWSSLQVPPGTQVPVMFDISHLPQVRAAADLSMLLGRSLTSSCGRTVIKADDTPLT